MDKLCAREGTTLIEDAGTCSRGLTANICTSLLGQLQTKDCRNNERSSRDFLLWFVDLELEALNLLFGRRHLGFLEPDVTNPKRGWL